MPTQAQLDQGIQQTYGFLMSCAIGVVMALICLGIWWSQKAIRSVGENGYQGLLKSAVLIVTVYAAVSLVILMPINMVAAPNDSNGTRSLLSTTWTNVKVGSNWTWIHVFVCLALTSLHLLYVAREISAQLSQRSQELQNTLFSEQMVSPSARTVFIPNLPRDWRNEHTLASVFNVFGDGVEAASITRRIPKSLQKDLKTRRKAVTDLETVLNRQLRNSDFKNAADLQLKNHQLAVEYDKSDPGDTLKVDVQKDLPSVPETVVIGVDLLRASLAPAHQHIILDEPGIPTVIVQGADDEAAAVAISPLAAGSQGCDEHVDFQFQARTCYMIEEEEEEDETRRKSEESHCSARSSVSIESSRSTTASSETAQFDSRSADISNFSQGLMALNDDICNQQSALLAAHINPTSMRSRENTLTSEDTMVDFADSSSQYVGQSGFVIFRSPRTAIWVAEKMNCLDPATKRRAGLPLGRVEWNCKVTDMCWDDLDLSQHQASRIRWIWWCVYILTFCIGAACSTLITMLDEVNLTFNRSPGLQALIQSFFSNVIPAFLLQLLFAISGPVFERIARAIPTSTLSSVKRRAQVMTVCFQITTLLIVTPVSYMIRSQDEWQSNWSSLFVASFSAMSAINLVFTWRGKNGTQGQSTDTCVLVTILVAAITYAVMSPVTTIPAVIVLAMVCAIKRRSNIPEAFKPQLHLQSCIGCVLGSLYLCASFMLQQEWAKASVLMVCATCTIAMMVVLWYRLSIPLRQLVDMKDCEVDTLNWRLLLDGQTRLEPSMEKTHESSVPYCTIHNCDELGFLCQRNRSEHNFRRWYYDPRLTEDMPTVCLDSANDVALLQRHGIPAALTRRI